MMSDDMISQDEIDALLRGTLDEETETGRTTDVDINEYFSELERDALGEIGNISFGSSATALSTLLNQKVEITTPSVSIVLKDELEKEFPHPYVAVHVNYTAGILGTNLLVIKQNDAAIIANLMLGGDGTNPSDELGEIELSAVQEAMNQMMGSAATSMSTIFNKRVDISPPSIDLLDIKEGEGTEQIPDEDMLVKVSFRLRIGDLIDSNIMQLLPIQFSKKVVAELLQPSDDKQATPSLTPPAGEAADETLAAIPADGIGENDLGLGRSMPETQAVQPPPSQQPTQQLGQQPTGFAVPTQGGPQHFGTTGYQTSSPANVQPAAFSSFEQPSLSEQEASNLNMLLDIPLQVTVELGRTKRSVKEILELSSGSIVELDKLAGEPVDILVNNRPIAKGEVVVIDENFGVRVTDIISQTDRLNNLK